MRPSVTTVGCVDERGTVLAACSYALYEYASLELLYKHSDAPRGLGKVVLRRTLANIVEAGAEGAAVMVREENVDMLRLCHAVGFTAIEHAEGTAWSLYLHGQEELAEGVSRLDAMLDETDEMRDSA